MVSKKFILLFLLFSLNLVAKNHVVTLNVSNQEKVLEVTPALYFQTSEDIKEAIDNGIRITIIAKAQLYIPQSFWFDKTLENIKTNFEVSYFTLSELYVVKNLSTGEQKAFNNYQQLWESFEGVVSFNFNTAPEGNIWVKVRIMLDKAALPTAMQLPVLFNSHWDVNTPWFKQSIKSK